MSDPMDMCHWTPSAWWQHFTIELSSWNVPLSFTILHSPYLPPTSSVSPSFVGILCLSALQDSSFGHTVSLHTDFIASLHGNHSWINTPALVSLLNSGPPSLAKCQCIFTWTSYKHLEVYTRKNKFINFLPKPATPLVFSMSTSGKTKCFFLNLEM